MKTGFERPFRDGCGNCVIIQESNVDFCYQDHARGDPTAYLPDRAARIPWILDTIAGGLLRPLERKGRWVYGRTYLLSCGDVQHFVVVVEGRRPGKFRMVTAYTIERWGQFRKLMYPRNPESATSTRAPNSGPL